MRPPSPSCVVGVHGCVRKSNDKNKITHDRVLYLRFEPPPSEPLHMFKTVLSDLVSPQSTETALDA